MNIDERFTRFADRFSELMGRWQTFMICLIAILIWFAWGPFAHWSDTWQLSINTPTTIAELFQEIIILAAANRVEKRNRELQERHAELQEKQQLMLEKIERLIEREEAELQRIENDLGQERTHP